METGGHGQNEEGGGVGAAGDRAGDFSAWWGEGAADEQSCRGGAGLVGPGDREWVRGSQSWRWRLPGNWGATTFFR